MGVFAGMHIWRAVAAKRNAALLAGAQVHPGIMRFYAFFAHIVFRMLQRFYGLQVFADIVFHSVCIDESKLKIMSFRTK